jgi:hypothetical protein
MSSDFWARKIGGIATPRPQQPPQAVPQGGAWWQEPASQQQPYGYPPQDYPPPPVYPQQYAAPPPGYNPALQAQMPGQPAPGSREQYIGQLKRVPTEQLNQGQMEEIAQFELDTMDKYNMSCPSCGSANFVPAGTVIQNKRMGSDKCFDCGASSSTYTSSPEPAGGGSSTSKARRLDIRQIDTGGAVESMYLKFDGVPAGYMPRL